MDLEAMIERNDRGEVRVLLAALLGLALLVVASVGIAVSDVAAASEPGRAGAEINAAPVIFD